MLFEVPHYREFLTRAWLNRETFLPKHCFLPLFLAVSKLGNIRVCIQEATYNVSDLIRKHSFQETKFASATYMFLLQLRTVPPFVTVHTFCAS